MRMLASRTLTTLFAIALAGLATNACSQRGGGQEAAGTDSIDDLAKFSGATGADGILTIDEYRAAEGRIVASLDRDANGDLSAAELAAISEGRRRAWLAYDSSGDGALSASELEAAVFPKFHAADRNQDGAVSRDEVPAGTPAGGYLF